MKISNYACVRLCLSAAAGLVALGPARADQQLVVTIPVSLDRWMYAFGDADGLRPTLPTYTALPSGGPGFDDRDAEVLLGFSTSAAVPMLDPSAYVIESAVVRAYVQLSSGEPGFAYDPTYDAAATYVPGATQVDADAGRPIELFAAGYRAGWTSATFQENSAYASAPPAVPPARGNRNVIPVDFGGPGGAARDVSNNITDFTGAPAPFDVQPLALGVAVGVAAANFQPPLAPPPDAGQSVPNRTLMEFTLGVDDDKVGHYVAQSLSQGRLNVLLTSIAPATAFGGGPVTYPIFYARNNALGRPATLELRVTIPGGACGRADVTGIGGTAEEPGAPDGQLTVDDIIVFINTFSDGTGCPGAGAPAGPACSLADVTGIGGPPSQGDGQLTVDDIIAFFNAFSDGC